MNIVNSGIDLHVLYQGDNIGYFNFKLFLSYDTDKESLVNYTLNKEISIKLKNQNGLLDYKLDLIFKDNEPFVSRHTFLILYLKRDVRGIFISKKKSI